MQPANRRPSEDARLQALHELKILDTPPEAALDALTRAAALACATPIALLSFVDVERQWFKSACGLAQGQETPREHAFCAHAITSPTEPFEVTDALADHRFRDNPLVTGEPRIRFYAGMPVRSEDGHALGTLCVIDRVSRQLSDEQMAALAELASGVGQLLADRRKTLRLSRQISAIYTQTPGLLYLLDDSGAIIEVSDLWLGHFGYERGQVIGRNAREFMSPSAREKFLEIRELLWAAGGCRDHPSQFLCADGRVVDVLISAAIEFDAQGKPRRVKCMLTDVTHQLALQRELESRARLDDLTGVANRGWFRELVDTEVSRGAQYGTQTSLVLFDIDDFKRINDGHGHAVGDHVLATLARIAESELRAADSIGRIGGEEFAILLPRTSIDAATDLAERIRVKIERTPWTFPLAGRVTISVGVTGTEQDTTVDALFSTADAAMYESKRAGRNRTTAYAKDDVRRLQTGMHWAGAPARSVPGALNPAVGLAKTHDDKQTRKAGSADAGRALII